MGYMVISWSNERQFPNVSKAFLTEKSEEVNHKSADDEKQIRENPQNRLMPVISKAAKGNWEIL